MDLREELLLLIEMGERDKLKEIFEEYHEVDIALAIREFDDEELKVFFELLDDETLALLLEAADEELQIRMLNVQPPQRAVRLFAHMESDDIVDILGELSNSQKKQLFQLMKSDQSEVLRVLLGYGPETAGGIMTTRYIALRSTYTTGQALKKIKQIGPRSEVIETLFVTNERKQLIGQVDLRDILSEPEDTTLEEIMDANVISVEADTDQEEVSRLVARYSLNVVPVLNRRRAILGIITVDDIIDVIVEEQTEDMLMMSGVSRDETIDSDLSDSVKRRLPWLYVNLLTAFLAAITVAAFQDVINQVVILAAVMPIIAGMGGNAGSQTLSVVIRSIALGDIDMENNGRLILKQVILGAVQGLSIGVVAGGALSFFAGNIYLGLIILFAMTINLLVASLFGYLIPVILRQFGVDPAVASSIFLTTMTDVCGFFVFLGLAKVFLPLLI